LARPKRKIVVLDTETGGLDPNTHSILSLGAVVWHDGGIDDTFYTLIAEPEIHADPAALKVNGLNLDTVRSEGADPLSAVLALNNFLLKNDLRGLVTVGGHNVSFDVGFVRRLFNLAGRKYPFSHRSLCTQTAALLLEQAGRIDPPGTSLDVLCKLFGIQVRAGGELGKHNALEDAKATALLLT